MSVTLSISDDAIVTLVGAFLTAVLPTGTPIIQGQANRVAAPARPDFVVFSPLYRRRLATDEPIPKALTTGGPLDGVAYKQRTMVGYQLDVHGPAGADNSQIITTLWRSPYGCEFFGVNVQPLYCEEPRQTAFINGEDEYEDRWVIEVVLQVNPATTISQQYADALAIGLIEADR